MKYMVGDAYTIVDMALWGWARLIPVALGEQAGVPTPLNRAISDILALYADGRPAV